MEVPVRLSQVGATLMDVAMPLVKLSLTPSETLGHDPETA